MVDISQENESSGDGVENHEATPEEASRLQVSPGHLKDAMEFFADSRLPPIGGFGLKGRHRTVLLDAESIFQLSKETVLAIDRLGSPPGFRSSPHRLPYYQAIVNLAEPMRVLTAASRMGLTQDSSNEMSLNVIEQAADRIAERLADLVSIFAENIAPTFTDKRSEAEIISELASERLRARRLVDETRAARDAAVEASDSARRAAGSAGSDSLAAHFSAHASRESRSANRLRIAASALLIAISAVAGLVLFTSEFTSESIARDVTKLSVTLPLAALAAYLGREASRHRNAASWSSQLEIQLKTLDAFISPLPASEQEKQRTELGRRVFGIQDAASVSPDNAPTLMADTAALLGNVANLIRPPDPKA